MQKRRILPNIIIGIAAVVAVFPIVFIFANSFMGGAEIVSRYSAEVMESNAGDFTSHGIHFVRFGLLPESFTLEQYQQLLLESPGYLRMFWNSVLLVLPVLLGQCVLAPLAAYGLENIQWKYKEAIFFMYIIVMLMPTQILLVPNFVALSAMGLIGSRLSVILVCAFSPYYVYFMFRICRQIPPEIFEAARMEGAGELRIYRSIAIPQMKSGIWLLVLIGSADLWNMVEQPLVFIQTYSKYPLTIFLRGLDNGYAGSIVFSLPVMLLFLLCGRDTVEQIERI